MRTAPAKKAKPGPSKRRLGLSLSELTAEQRKELGAAGGVLVEDAQGAGGQGRYSPRRRHLAINNQDVKSVEQFNQLMGQFEKGQPSRCCASR